MRRGAISEASPFETIVAGLYDAALDPPRWQDALDAYAQGFGGQAVMYSQDMLHSGANVFALARVDPGIFGSYESYYSRRKPWLTRIDRAPAGSIVTLDWLIDAASYRKTEYYNDFLDRLDIFYLYGAIIRKDSAATTVATIVRSLRAGDFTADEIATAQRLVPHFQRAIQMHRQLYAAELERNGMLRGLDALGIAAFLVAADGALLFANAKAEAILRCGEALAIAHRRLRAATPAVTQSLLRLIAGAALTGAGRGTDAGGVLALPRPFGPPLSLLACPVPMARIALGAAQPAALLFVSDPADKVAPDQGRLRQLYGLSPAEARLASSLVAGTALKDYAERAGITLATAKTQLRSIFAKTGQDRQSDLIRLMLVNPAVR